MTKLSTYLKTFLAAMLLLVGSTYAWAVDDWKTLGVAAPTTDGFYYLYNDGSSTALKAFISVGTGTSPSITPGTPNLYGATLNKEAAAMFYVTNTNGVYNFAYQYNGETKYIHNYSSITMQAASSTEKDFAVEESGETNRYYFKGKTYYLGWYNGSFAINSYVPTSGENIMWSFIPRADYLSNVETTPSDSWTAMAANSFTDKGLYYVYNPKSGRFLQSNKNITNTATPTTASLFQLIEQDGKYMLMSANTAGNGVVYVNTTDAATWNATPAYFTIAKKGETNRYMMYTTVSGANKYLVTRNTQGTTFALNTIKNDATYPYDDVAADDPWNEWMFIPANALETAISPAPAGDTKTGTTPTIGQQYFLWNVEAKKFFGSASTTGALVSNAQQAVLCTIGGTENNKTISYVATGALSGYEYYIAPVDAGAVMMTPYVLEWEETSSGSGEYFIYSSTSAANIHLSADKTYLAFRGVAIQNGARPADINGRYKWVFVAPDKVAYYQAAASSAEGGEVSIKINGTSSEYGATTSLTGSQPTISDNTNVEVTYTARPKIIVGEHGYSQEGRFLGWVQTQELFGQTITVPVSTDNPYVTTEDLANGTEGAPTQIANLHADFELVNAFDAKLLNDRDELVKIGDKDGGSIAEVLAKAYTVSNSTVVLMRDVLPTSKITITGNVTIDFNNYKIKGNFSDLLTVSASGKTVRFVDNSPEATGGVYLVKTGSFSNELNAVKLTAGTLTMTSGVISAQHTHTSSGSTKITGIKVTGGTFNLQGGEITTSTNLKGYNGTSTPICGVFVNGSSIVNLENGTISAVSTASSTNNRINVIGVDAYGASSAKPTVNITWNVKINAKAYSAAYGVYSYYANVIIDGGVITAEGDNATPAGNIYGVYHANSSTSTTISGNAEVNAKNGAANNCNALWANGSTCTINGGFLKSTSTCDVRGYYNATEANRYPTINGGYFAHQNVQTGTNTTSTYKSLNDMKPSTSDITEVTDPSILANGYNYMVFKPGEILNAVATADEKGFASLEDAIAYANNNAERQMTIRLQVPTYTLSAGTYTIPVNATLLIPYSRTHLTPQVACPGLNDNAVPHAAFCALTLAPKTHIDVFGAIEVGGQQNNYGTSATGTGRPNSDYGQLIMGDNSQIIVNNGAKFRAWGFVTGTGSIDVRRGAVVHEMFQIYDFKGGNGTLNMSHVAHEFGRPENTHKSFPVSQYHIQNIEVPTKYRPGSALYGAMAAVNTGVVVKVIGINTDVAAIFFMDDKIDSEDTWVEKWYNSATDQQVYDINNSAAINNMELNFGVYTFNSAEYTLPITNNMKIHLLSGEMHITQNTTFLPGVELEINKLSTMTIDENVNLYLHDSEQWGAYSFKDAYASKIKYRPGGVPGSDVRDISSAAGLGDAQINVHGTIAINGALRTTDGGANIFSTNADAGTVTFAENSVSTDAHTFDVWTHQTGSGSETEPHYIDYHAASAKLKNGNGAFTSTVGATTSTSYCYINGTWRNMEQEDDCFVSETVAEVKTYYAKPKDYVALSSGEEDDNHLYHSVDGMRTFITTTDGDGNCQWWEVEDVDGHPELKHCTHPENDVYYIYENDEWKEKRFTITWRNWDGTLIETYEMKMGAKLQYLGSIPSRAKTDYYTYDFAGWSPTISEDAVVTGDATYIAQFNQTDRKYLITFTGKANWGVDSKQEYLGMGEIPTPPDLGVMAGMIMWTPAVSPVTGDATYEVVAADPFATSFTITFVNWDGTQLQSGSVDAGEMPEYTGATPVKPALGDESYTFIGWTPAIAAATADAVYMATYEASHVSGLNISDEQTISDERVVTELRITTTGTLTITGTVTADNLYLESNSTISGQLDATNEKIHATNAYFEWSMNGAAGTQRRTWYAIAVPWEVNAESGIFWKEGNRHLILGRDFDLVWYDGAERAANGDSYACWRYVEDESDKIMHPGKMYMMYFGPEGIKTVRFAKASGAQVIYTSPINVEVYLEQTDNEGKDGNWNGIANPRTYYASLETGASFAQILGNGNLDDAQTNPENVYTTIDVDASKFIVGQPLYVQAVAAQPVVVNKVTSAGIVLSAAPRRAKAHNLPDDILTRFALHIAAEGKTNADNLFIQVTEDAKENKYVIGQDLVKGGVAKSVPQLWVNRYDSKLSVNTQTLIGNVAEYPLSIYAPQDGDYVINTDNADDEYALYLTKDGQVIWNLGYAPYTITMDKGVSTAYGLRIMKKSPEVTTTVEEAIIDAHGETRKVLINGQVFIIRDGNVYSIFGQKAQ